MIIVHYYNIIMAISKNHPLIHMRATCSYPGPNFHNDTKNDNK